MALDNPSYFSVDKNCESSQQLISSKSGHETSAVSTFTELSTQSLRKDSRVMLRSISSTSADSNQELLIQGEPRMLDIAPDLQVFKFPNSEPKRSNSLKTKSELLQNNDLIYFPLPTSEETNHNISDEEVFVTDEVARYYNFSATNNRRRHSIGTFTARERTTSTVSSNKSFKEVPQISPLDVDDHSLRHASFPRKRCVRCTRGTVKKYSNMDDILIVSVKTSHAAALWVDYFTSYFEQISKQANRKKFKVLHIGIEEIVESNGNIAFIAEKTAGVKLQLIIICPSLLDHIAMHPEPSAFLAKLFVPEKTLALLLGVTDDDINDVHRMAFPTYSSWQRLGVGEDQDTNFASNFLSTAMSIFSKVWKKQSSVVTQEKSQFSIVPKKVRAGQNGVAILLNYPLQKEDVVKVSIEKNNELTEIVNIRRKNPYTIKMNIPDSLLEVSAIVNIIVEKNGSIIGNRPIKCESRLRELEQILRSINNPIGFVCQALGFSPQDKEQLDNCMHHLFLKNLPPNFNLLNTLKSLGNEHKHSCDEYPTLLHFAAKYGLVKLALELLDCPGGDLACDIRNNYDLNPADLAENAGHSDLAQHLRGYMKMNEFFNVYSKLKEISQKQEAILEDQHYMTPRNVDDVYKVCPPPRPVVTPSAEEQSLGYMEMNKSQNRPKDLLLQLTNDNIKQEQSFQNLLESNTKSPRHSQIKSPTSDFTKNKLLSEDKVQTELLEIINDFKNNVHSIAQAEKLVEEWKNRNDVQKSFKEKQEQLNEMRLKYENMQQEMKCGIKKNNPLDRFINLFTKNKQKEKEKQVTNLSQNAPLIGNNRPISSLSIQSTSSSGSSGRMSTISGCSVGDSGTHSDHEDRKTLISSPCEEDFVSDFKKPTIISMNYIVPPAPKPVNPNFQFNKQKLCGTIEDRPPLPIPRPEINIDSGDANHNSDSQVEVDCMYLEFDKEPSQPYINMAPVSEDTFNEDHEYMNFSITPKAYNSTRK